MLQSAGTSPYYKLRQLELQFEFVSKLQTLRDVALQERHLAICCCISKNKTGRKKARIYADRQ